MVLRTRYDVLLLLFNVYQRYKFIIKHQSIKTYFSPFCTERYNVGDIVILSSCEDIVKESFVHTYYIWDDRMRSMLGNEWKVLNVLDDIVVLTSPDGSENEKWYFHKSVLFHKPG